MDGRKHFIANFFSLFVFIPLLIFIDIKYIPLLILSILLIDPDEDQKWVNGKTHRNFFTHSILLPLVVSLALGFSLELLAVLSLPTLVHLILDIPGKNKQGKYCIWFFGKRMNGIWSVIYLSFNSLLVLILWLILFDLKYHFFIL